jgi:hypothetical protein
MGFVPVRGRFVFVGLLRSGPLLAAGLSGAESGEKAFSRPVRERAQAAELLQQLRRLARVPAQRLAQKADEGGVRVTGPPIVSSTDRPPRWDPRKLPVHQW